MKKIKPKVTVVSRKISQPKPVLDSGLPYLSGKEIGKQCPQLASWLKPLARWSQGVVRVFNIEPSSLLLYGAKKFQCRYKVCFNTSENTYYVTAIPKRYLGCVVVSRKARVGENWFRGNDLRDGRWSKATWQKILLDIVAYELEPYATSGKTTVKEMQETRHVGH